MLSAEDQLWTWRVGGWQFASAVTTEATTPMTMIVRTRI